MLKPTKEVWTDGGGGEIWECGDRRRTWRERKKALLTEGDRKIKKDTHLQHFEVS